MQDIPVDKMKVAVLGLGMEGKNAVKSLLDDGHHVYASDLNENIVINEFGRANLESRSWTSQRFKN